MNKTNFYFTISLLIFTSCSGSKTPSSGLPINKQNQPANIGKEEPVNATIVSKDIIPKLKRSLFVQLDKRVTQEVLTDIAIKIKNSDTQEYERTFISFYLPNMPIASFIWATAHFEPELEVKINGLTVDEANFLKSQTIDSTYTIVGNWFEETLKRRTVIFYDKEKAFIEYLYTDNTNDTRPLREKKCGNGRLFEEAKVNFHNEFFLIDQGDVLLVTSGPDTIITGIKMH